MNTAIYRESDGKILYFMGPNEQTVISQLLPGENYFLGCDQTFTHIIDASPVCINQPPDPDFLLARMRTDRNQKLTACDWTQTLDAPLTAEKKAEWAVYRQALRDFPDVCDPVAPVWPVAPI